VVAAALDPAQEDGRLADMKLSQISTGMGALQHDEFTVSELPAGYRSACLSGRQVRQAEASLPMTGLARS